MKVAKILRRVLLVVLSTLTALGLAELGVRWLRPQQLIDLRPDIWRPEEGPGWSRAPHLDTLVNTGEGPVHLRTDAYGHRWAGGTSNASAGNEELSILLLGDSFPAALQVEYEDTFGALLERSLEQRLGQSVKIVNGAVSGWGPNQYLIAARRELGRQHYHLVLLCLYLGNDLEPRLTDRLMPRNPVERHPLRWPQTFRREELTMALAYPINDFLETRSHFFVLARRRAKPWLQKAKWSAYTLPKGLMKDFPDQVQGWDGTAQRCREIQQLAVRQGIPTHFLLLPGLYHLDRSLAVETARLFGLPPDRIDAEQGVRELSQRFAASGLTWTDLTPPMERAFQRGQQLFGNVDTHLSRVGHTVIAEALETEIIPILQVDPEPVDESLGEAP